MLTLERPRPPENRETAKLRSSSTKLSQKSGEVPSLILLISLLMYIQYCAIDSLVVYGVVSSPLHSPFDVLNLIRLEFYRVELTLWLLKF